MYQLSIQEEFVAQHFLTVPNCGPENILHSHVYAIEVLLESSHLNKYGYLVDIDDVKFGMKAFIDEYRDHTLNDKEAFEDLNPSIEHFSRIAVEYLEQRLDISTIEKITVRMWEDRHCWASFTKEV